MEPYQDVARILTQVKKAVIGKDGVLIRVMLAVLARGHVLLEDIPGVGKTTMALAFSKALGLSYRRVQFTPDVMPSDLTGFSIYNKTTGKMEYQPGALLCSLFLADELNRATSRTQSALLEAMEEGRVTVDGVTHPIPQPFLVIATQNPAGASGTQLLPDSQLDRFTLRLSIGYPSHQDEMTMVRRRNGSPMERVEQVIDAQGLEQLRQQVEAVYLSDQVLDYLIRLIDATPSAPHDPSGSQPPGHSGFDGSQPGSGVDPWPGLCVPEDVKAVFRDVIDHRLIYAPQTARDEKADPLEEVLRSVKAPSIR